VVVNDKQSTYDDNDRGKADHEQSSGGRPTGGRPVARTGLLHPCSGRSSKAHRQPDSDKNNIPAANQASPAPRSAPEESAKLEELVDRLKALQEQKGPGRGAGDDAEADVLMEAMKKLMSGEQPNMAGEANNPGVAGKNPKTAGKGPYKPPQRPSGSSKVDPRAQRSSGPARRPPQLPSRYQDPRRGR